VWRPRPQHKRPSGAGLNLCTSAGIPMARLAASLGHLPLPTALSPSSSRKVRSGSSGDISGAGAGAGSGGELVQGAAAAGSTGTGSAGYVTSAIMLERTRLLEDARTGAAGMRLRASTPVRGADGGWMGRSRGGGAADEVGEGEAGTSTSASASASTSAMRHTSPQKRGAGAGLSASASATAHAVSQASLTVAAGPVEKLSDLLQLPLREADPMKQPRAGGGAQRTKGKGRGAEVVSRTEQQLRGGLDLRKVAQGRFDFVFALF
jgi:hypothetical protein